MNEQCVHIQLRELFVGHIFEHLFIIFGCLPRGKGGCVESYVMYMYIYACASAFDWESLSHLQRQNELAQITTRSRQQRLIATAIQATHTIDHELNTRCYELS
jgi:hypothetical protein